MTDAPDHADPFDGPAWSDGGMVTLRPDGTVIGRSGRRRMSARTRNRQRRRRRTGKIMILAGAGLILLTGVLLVVTALLAKSELTDMRDELTALRAQVTSGDIAQLKQRAHAIADSAESAHDLTSGPLWDAVAAIPWFGKPFETTQGIAAAADRLGTSAVPELVSLADTLDPKKLRDADGRFDLAAIAGATPTIERGQAMTRAVQREVDDLPSSTWLSSVDDGRTQVVDALDRLSATLESVDRAAKLLPTMLGKDGPKRYFIGFLNEAELRGTGGLPGAFAIAKADHGLIKIEHFESDSALFAVTSGVTFDRDYQALYGLSRSTSVYVNSSMSPDFGKVGRIWAGFWRTLSGERIDGAIALDPTALSYFLTVTGPTQLKDGTVISAESVVALTQQQVYARFPGGVEDLVSNAQRRQYLLDIAKAVEDKVLNSTAISGLAKAAGLAAGERRLVVWSRDPSADRLIQETSFAGRIPHDPTPFAGPVIINAAAGKLDYYLERRFTWHSAGCGETRRVTATLRLTNNAPRTGLSPYVVGRFDKRVGTYTPGDNHLLLQYYATTGAHIKSATIDGQPASFGRFFEANHPVYVDDLELPVGQTRTIVLTFEETGPYAPVTVLDQPGVVPQTVHTSATC